MKAANTFISLSNCAATAQCLHDEYGDVSSINKHKYAPSTSSCLPKEKQICRPNALSAEPLDVAKYA